MLFYPDKHTTVEPHAHMALQTRFRPIFPVPAHRP